MTGKEINREELSSVLRDAWEGMLVRDIATAGGIDVRQVRAWIIVHGPVKCLGNNQPS